jgi:hypothetical protein
MDILFFIGNGFDLKMGLKTSFRNVLEAYLLESSSDEKIINFKRNINNNFENWSDFEFYMGEYTEKIVEDNILDYFQCIYDFTRFLKTYLKNEENKALFENTKEISQAFQKSILHFYNFLDEHPKKIISGMMNDVIKFNQVNFNYTKIFDICLEIMKQDKTIPLSRKVGAVSYTNTNNNYMGNIFHIHGTLENEMILGVDNLEQIKNIDFRKLTRSQQIVKPFSNDLLENRKNEIIRELISKSSIYCIFGMSLGKTDKTWWIEIIKQMVNNKNKRLIIFIHDDSSDFSLSFDKIETKEYWKIRLFNNLKFTELNKDEIKDDIKTRIHIIVNASIFDLKLI